MIKIRKGQIWANRNESKVIILSTKNRVIVYCFYGHTDISRKVRMKVNFFRQSLKTGEYELSVIDTLKQQLKEKI